MPLIVLLPLACLIGILIKCGSKGPVIFRHQRIGKSGDPIRILKFRTMNENADQLLADLPAAQKALRNDSFKLADDPRITRFGRFLRKTYLDELPQLLNILQGMLTFIAPRPITAEKLKKYGDQMEKLLSVTPGLTGYWQVFAPEDCTYKERIQMELYYIDHSSLLWNLKIFIFTIGAVFSGKGQ